MKSAFVLLLNDNCCEMDRVFFSMLWLEIVNCKQGYSTFAPCLFLWFAFFLVLLYLQTCSPCLEFVQIQLCDRHSFLLTR